MNEIEILVELYDTVELAVEKFSKFEYKGKKLTIDTYFYDPLRPELQLDQDGKLMESFRLREKGGSCFLTYKNDIYDGKIWQYSEEHESRVDELEPLLKIVGKLGLLELVRIHNTKHTFESPDYEIVVEEVVDLGNFLEVEYKHVAETPEQIEEAKRGITRFISEMGLKIGDELNSGKPELMLHKKHNAAT